MSLPGPRFTILGTSGFPDLLCLPAAREDSLAVSGFFITLFPSRETVERWARPSPPRSALVLRIKGFPGRLLFAGVWNQMFTSALAPASLPPPIHFSPPRANFRLSWRVFLDRKQPCQECKP